MPRNEPDPVRDSGNDVPRWRQDFPVASGEDSYATRREFTKFLGLTSVAFVFGTCVAAARKIWRRWSAVGVAGVPVAQLSELEVGGYKLFRYPTEHDPGILLRLGTDRFAAFSQNCSHLACPVHFDPEAGRLRCPCHIGIFSADDGRALAGPPRRGLEAFRVEIREDQIWVEPGESSA